MQQKAGYGCSSLWINLSDVKPYVLKDRAVFFSACMIGFRVSKNETLDETYLNHFD